MLQIETHSDLDFAESSPFLSSKPIVDNWYRIKKKDIPPEILEIHKNNLSIKPYGLHYITNEELPATICYDENDEEFMCPFFYGIMNFGEQFEDRRNRGKIDTSRKLEFKSTLDEEILKQVSACNAIVEALNSVRGAALLALPPGSGKTRCGCYSWIKTCEKEGGIVPTLILVHTDFLIDQWIERLQELIPDARIGLMKNSDYKDKDIVICTIQSLITKIKDKKTGEIKIRYSQDMMKRFGMVIIDVSLYKLFFFDNLSGGSSYPFYINYNAYQQDISARKFCQSFPLTGMRRILLLTGTPYRNDRGEKVAESWIGPVTFQTKRIYTRKVYVHIVDPKYEPMKVKMNFKNKPDYIQMVKDIAICNERNKEVIEQIIDLADMGRQILVLSALCGKIKHLHILKDLLFERRSDIRSSLFYGKTKKAERSAAMKAQVIFSSYKMASEAMDIPSLSVVALVTGKKNIEQAIYRGIRGKYQLFDPVILDFRDNFGLWYNYWKKRAAFYKQEGFEFVYLENKIEDEDECVFSVAVDPEECPFTPTAELKKRRVDVKDIVSKKRKMEAGDEQSISYKPTLSERMNKKLKFTVNTTASNQMNIEIQENEECPF